MKLRREKILWNVLLGTSVYLLDSLRGRLSEGIDDLSDRARDTYSTASRRASARLARFQYAGAACRFTRARRAAD